MLHLEDGRARPDLVLGPPDRIRGQHVATAVAARAHGSDGGPEDAESKGGAEVLEAERPEPIEVVLHRGAVTGRTFLRTGTRASWPTARRNIVPVDQLLWGCVVAPVTVMGER